MKPRLGFAGVGWIGLNRMEIILASGHAEAGAVFEPSEEMFARARERAPSVKRAQSFEELIGDPSLDGIVIASPSALHAEQSVRALEAGKAVFCQKPLGRDAGEVSRVLDAARRADRLLAVDLSYRFTAGMRRIYGLLAEQNIGKVYSADLTFHNAYGPDKAWFYDPKLAGGGCVMDLGIHLVDLALWCTGFPAVEHVTSRLFSGGNLLRAKEQKVEDYAVARLDLAGGRSVQLACSWKLPAGTACVISAYFYGTEGALAFRNVNGSFYDFVAERYRGTSRELLVDAGDDWSGQAGVDWARRLSEGERYNPEAERILQVTEALDAIYGRHPGMGLRASA